MDMIDIIVFALRTGWILYCFWHFTYTPVQAAALAIWSYLIIAFLNWCVGGDPVVTNEYLIAILVAFAMYLIYLVVTNDRESDE